MSVVADLACVGSGHGSWHVDEVSDLVMVAKRLHEEVAAAQLEGFGALRVESPALVLWWKGGKVPPRIARLIAESDTRVLIRSCRYTEHELLTAVQSLVHRRSRLPFTMLGVGPLPGAAGVAVEAPEPELPAARQHFTSRPLRLPDGSAIHVHLEPTGYPALVTYPLRARTAKELADIDPDRYVGLHVDEATLRAQEDGWLVRSSAENAGGALTLDRRRNRLNLNHNQQGTVLSAHVG